MVLFWLLVCLVCRVASLQGPQLAIEQGALKGTYLESANGKTFAAFQGIPYARPPVGKHRFKEPVPAKPWSGVWNAQSPGSNCLQPQYGNHVAGDEDCLYLNVYSPVNTAGRQLDVIVNIHGGAFMMGSGDAIGPKYLMDRDVVVVTLNYRLGPLGFFSTGDEVVPGNNGLKDQTLALLWVQKNIAAFGGDPARVTITGTSAGGASVHMHYLSPLSRGLFSRGISQSGTALCPWTRIEELKETGERLAASLGCPTHSSRDLVDCLRQRPATAIVQHIRHLRVWLGLPFTPFGPTIEVKRPGAFLAEQPIDVIMEGRAMDVPWITGVTSEEGLYPAAEFLTNEEKTSQFSERWDEIVPVMLDFNATVAPGQRASVAQRIKKFYLGDKPVTKGALKEIVQMIGDRLFVADAQLTAQLQAKHSTAPIYFYQFGYRGKNSLSNLLSQTTENMGASHGDDAGYVFEVGYCKTDETEADKAMTQLMVDWWISYITTGEPSPSAVAWQPVSGGQKALSYLYLGSSTSVEMRSAADLGNRHFWDSLPIREAAILHGASKRAGDEL